MILTLLSLSLGGSWGSLAEGLGGGREGALGFSLLGGVSALGFSVSTFFDFAGEGSEAALLGLSSDGATWVTPPDFEMTAILEPGSTVSPTLATSWK